MKFVLSVSYCLRSSSASAIVRKVLELIQFPRIDSATLYCSAINEVSYDEISNLKLVFSYVSPSLYFVIERHSAESLKTIMFSQSFQQSFTNNIKLHESRPLRLNFQVVTVFHFLRNRNFSNESQSAKSVGNCESSWNLHLRC